MSETYSASNRTIHLWAVGAMADYMLYVSFNALIMPVFTIEFGLNPFLVGLALTLPRVFDGIIDPMLGHWSDDTHSRWGRRKPFMVAAAGVGAFMAIAIWWPSTTWPEAGQFAYIAIASIVLFTCWGLYSMTHMALGYELSDDYYIRTKVFAVRGLYASIAALSGGWMYWFTLRPFFGNGIRGVRFLSLGIATVAILAMLVPVTFCQERFKNVNRRHVHLWTAIRTALQVRPFVILILLSVTATLGTALYGTMGIYINFYYVCQGNKSLGSSLSGWNGMVGFLVAFALVPLSTVLSRRLGKTRGLRMGYTATFIGAILLPLIARPGHPYYLLAHMITFGITNAVFMLFFTSLMPDICDLDELESGQRREGLFAAVMAFVGKLQNSLCILIGGFLLNLAGFNAKLVQKGVLPSHDVLNRLRWLSFTPMILFSGLALALSFYYPVTKEKIDEVHAILAERRKARAAEEIAEPSVVT